MPLKGLSSVCDVSVLPSRALFAFTSGLCTGASCQGSGELADVYRHG